MASCHDGTYCENSPGKYICKGEEVVGVVQIMTSHFCRHSCSKACHVACLGGCHGAGTGGCVACKEGYVMGDTDGCKGTIVYPG